MPVSLQRHNGVSMAGLAPRTGGEMLRVVVAVIAAAEMAAGFVPSSAGRTLAPLPAGLRRASVARPSVTMMARRGKGVVKENFVSPYLVLGVPKEVVLQPVSALHAWPCPRAVRVSNRHVLCACLHLMRHWFVSGRHRRPT